MTLQTDSYRVAGIMGWPVAQSRSPLIHKYWLAKYGLLGDYVRLPVDPRVPDSLKNAVAGMRAMGFAGCNLTMPHKSSALAFVDQLDPIAKQMGAVNTLVIAPDGAVCGFNNDGYGYLESLLEVMPTWRTQPVFARAPVMVLGAGGAARAVILALARAGAVDIRIANRTDTNADLVAHEFSQTDGMPVRAIAWSQRNAGLADCALLVNATNQGMYGQPDLQIDLTALPTSAVVSDLVYVPLETTLIKAAKARGHTTVGGLGMLLHQARPAFKAWFGVDPEITPELRQNLLATFA